MDQSALRVSLVPQGSTLYEIRGRKRGAAAAPFRVKYRSADAGVERVSVHDVPRFVSVYLTGNKNGEFR